MTTPTHGDDDPDDPHHPRPAPNLDVLHEQHAAAVADFAAVADTLDATPGALWYIRNPVEAAWRQPDAQAAASTYDHGGCEHLDGRPNGQVILLGRSGFRAVCTLCLPGARPPAVEEGGCWTCRRTSDQLTMLYLVARDEGTAWVTWCCPRCVLFADPPGVR